MCKGFVTCPLFDIRKILNVFRFESTKKSLEKLHYITSFCFALYKIDGAKAKEKGWFQMSCIDRNPH